MQLRRLQFMLLFFLLYGSVTADILHIPEEYATLQNAVVASHTGDTLLLAHGTYQDSVVILTHGLTLASQYLMEEDSLHINETIISVSAENRAVTCDADGDFYIVGLTFADCHPTNRQDGGVIRCWEGSYTIQHCKFLRNSGYRGGAIHLFGESLLLQDCLFLENSTDGLGGAVMLLGGQTTVERCVFKGNETFDAGGAIFSAFSGGIIRDNIFIDNDAGFAAGSVRLSDAYSWEICYNTFEESDATLGGAIRILSLQELLIHNNRIKDNYVRWVEFEVPGDGGGVRISTVEQTALIYENLFTNNTAEYKGAAITIGTDCGFYNNIVTHNTGYRDIIDLFNINGVNPNLLAQSNYIASNNRLGDFTYFSVIRASLSTLANWSNNDFIANSYAAAGHFPALQGEMQIENNYWGHPTGPYHAGINPGGLGDTILTTIDVENWSPTPFTNFQTPNDFSLLSPNDNFTTHEAVSLQWEEGGDPNDGDSLRFWVEIAPDINFDPDFTRRWRLGTTDHLDNLDLEIGEYYWRVRCLDPLWLETLSRETWHFEVVAQPPPPEPPAPFNLLAPEDGVVLTDSIIQFAWEASSIPNQIGDVSYTLILVDDSNPPSTWTYETMSDTTLQVTLPNWEELTQWHVAAVNDSSDTTFSNQTWSFFATGVKDDDPVLPETFHIVSIHPNPFNDHVTVSIALPKLTEVKFHVVDVLGRLVVQPSKRTFTAGFHDLTLHLPRAAGTYFLVITGPEGNMSRHKLVLVK
ncbi:T9SS type A sorting domain-containing protein [bacterium]|nr:T9SS type A sorting domain-containing protein [bacterium]